MSVKNNNGKKYSPSEDWQALNYFNVYRILISLLFVTLVWIEQLPDPLGAYDSRIFTFAAHAYFVSSILIIFLIRMRLPYLLQLCGHTLLDITLITVMMYASNGLNSGFGMLLVITVAGASLLSGRRIAIFFAALATIAVLGHEIHVQFFQIYRLPNYTHAGLLGITFFTTAFLSYVIASRVAKSEAIAKQQAVDLKSLARLNDYIVQRLQSGIIVLDNDHYIRLINGAARIMLGIDRNINNSHLQSSLPRLYDLLASWLDSDIKHFVFFKPDKGDEEIQVSFARHSPDTKFGILIFLENIGEIRQRVQQIKLASLGRLAASIAHEVRNPIGAVAHAAQLLSESTEVDVDDKRLLQIINEQTKRVNTIIQNVETISRRKPSSPETVNLNSWLSEFIDEFAKEKNLSNTSVKLEFENNGFVVNADTSQLYQVLWNICENSIRYSRGTPLLELRCGTRADTQRVYIDIRDFGDGMSDTVENHLFEPFFTTDTSGTGLGLYIARELCEANQASLVLFENTDNGCCFRITFPHYLKKQESIQ